MQTTEHGIVSELRRSTRPPATKGLAPVRLAGPVTTAQLLALQRQAGNTTVGLLLGTAPVVQRCGPVACSCSAEEREAKEAPAVQRSAAPDEVVQRDDDPLRANDPRLNDPGFLICTAFCYLGVPPSFFKDIISAMLECLSTEMRAADAVGYQRRFATAREELAGYSKIRLLGKAFRFLMHGELGPGGIIRITARSQAIRDRITARLLAFGATHAGLVAAEAVVRKVLLVIDAIIVAGCASYCGAVQIGQRVVELTEAISQGFTSAMEILDSVNRGLGQLLGDAIANGYGQLDPANWIFDPILPERTRADLSVLGASLWAQVRPGSPWVHRQPNQTEIDSFLANSGRPLSGYRIPRELMEQIAAATQRSIALSGGRAQITADQLLAMSPMGLVAFLRDNELLFFRRNPIDYANEAIQPQPAATP